MAFVLTFPINLVLEKLTGLEGVAILNPLHAFLLRTTARAKVDPFFAQVWNPLHDENEKGREYEKEVSESEI
jgi:hypothetical protein